MQAALPFPDYDGPLADILRSWVDPQFGVATSLTEIPNALAGADWWVYAANLARTPPGNWYSPFPAGAAGCSIDRSHAMTTALGEIVERYSALCHDYRPMLERVPFDEIDSADALPRCAAAENCPPSFKGRLGRTPVPCVPMRRLHDGATTLYPADWACLNHVPEEGETVVGQPISTGLSAHPDLFEAIWRGYCEVVERDNMMTMWWLGRPIRRLEPGDLTALPAPLAERLARIEACGMRVQLYDIGTEDDLCCVFSILIAPHYPFAVAGASCGADPVRACCKALDENVSVRLTMIHDPGPLPEPMLSKFDWVVSLHQHAALYADVNGARSLPSILNRSAAAAPIAAFLDRRHEPPADMRALTAMSRRLSQAGRDLLWMDVTCGEIEGRCHVVKVVVPGLQPLAQSYGARWLGGVRLAEINGGPVAPERLNPYPHPFA